MIAMSIDEIIKQLPAASWNAISEKLADIILNSKSGDKMPSDLAKTILYHWQKDQLATETGLQKLLKAAVMLEPEKTTKIFEELDLAQISMVLKALKI